MSVKNCFKNSSNKAIKSSFDKKVKAGIPEEEAALAVIKEYGADIQARLSKIKGVDVADIVLFDGVVKTETKKSMVTTQQQAVRIVSREKEIDPGIKGLRNRVIDLFTMALKDPKYFEETMTSIDNDTLKEGTLSMIDKIAPESMDLFDPVKAIDTRFSYRTGGSGVAVSANSSSDHVLTQGVNWNIEFDQGTWGNSTFDQKFSEGLSNEDFNKNIYA